MNMSRGRREAKFRRATLFALALLLPVSGCAATKYYRARREGQKAMIAGMYGPARYFFAEARTYRPRSVNNLHDLGACSVMLARQKFEQMNHAAAMRELDAAVANYSEVLDADPAHQASIEGKNVALELKGQFDEALKHAEWTAKFVGPSARQYIFLATELEERGHVDDALLRYRQAVAVEPGSTEAHLAFAKFLIRSKNEEAAIHHLQAAYRLDPRNEWVIDELSARGALQPIAGEGTAKP